MVLNRLHVANATMSAQRQLKRKNKHLFVEMTMTRTTNMYLPKIYGIKNPIPNEFQ